MTIKSFYIKFLFLLFIYTLIAACNPSRRLKDDEHLLSKIKVIDKDTKITNADITGYIKQKPNRRIFKVVRFHLWLHNLINEDRVKRRRILRDASFAKRNEIRLAKGKTAKKNSKRLLGEWVLDNSEAPVVYDSVLTKKSVRQLKSLLNKKGYFTSSVTDSVYYTNRHEVNVYYKIHAASPLKIEQLDYKIQDDSLRYYVFVDTMNSLVKKGNNYDEDVFDSERERITANLNNNGYYLFTKDYIYYQWDSSDRKARITLGIKNFATKFSENSDSIVESPHERFYINDVFIETDFVLKRQEGFARDTIKVDDFGKRIVDKNINPSYYIIHTDKLRYKTRVLLNTIFIHKGEIYRLKTVEDTYKRLQEIKSFKSINISFVPCETDKLNCFIRLTPILKQSYTIEADGKNTSGNFGIGGSIVYQNRNLLKGAEVFELKFKGSIEATKTVNNTSSLKGFQKFNAIEYGPEANIYVPRFLIPFNIKAPKRANPKTVFTSSYTFQHLPYLINNIPNFYTRYITNLSFGYNWKQSSQISHSVTPLMVSIVKVELPSELADYLTHTNIFIQNSFSPHVTTSTRYTFTYNQQNINKLTNFSFFRLNAESSGNILRGTYQLINSAQPNTLRKDDQGSYYMFGIPFSQYVRTDVDYRYYLSPNEDNKLVFRFAAGIGKPFANYSSLPFERSFFGGGVNDIRAWQARSLGPGSYSSNGQTNLDQSGDGQLQFNVEYRFKIIKQFNGALFVEGGNVWLREPDSKRPGGDFQFDRFYKEIAIGSGIGLRADFSFFVIRLDLGIKLYDPQFAESQRWVIQNYNNYDWREKYSDSHYHQKYGFLALNLGIGYPF